MENIKAQIGAAFAEMFYNRQDRGDIRTALEASKAYEEANIAVRSVREAVEGQIDIKLAGELFEALLRLADIERQYYYRLGIQEGLYMQGSAFLTEGL